MKKISLTLVSIFTIISISGYAQIAIDSVDMPIVGDVIVMGVDTMPSGISVGGTGLQTWDFTGLQLHLFDSTVYVDPATTAYVSDFPGSNLAVDDAGTVSYQTLSSSSLINNGYAGLDPFGAGVIATGKFNPTQTVLQLPTTSGDSFMDTSGFDVTISTDNLGLPVPGLDSVRMIHTSYVSSTIDAHGQMSVLGGDYPTIRQLYDEETIDSIYAYCSEPAGCNVFIVTLPFGWSFLSSVLTDLVVGLPNPAVLETYTYKWYTNGESLPIAWAQTDGIGGAVQSAGFSLGDKPIATIASFSGALCNTSCDGQATVSVFSGTAPFTYVWDDPSAQTNANATGLCAGSYTVFVIDALGDSSNTASVVISEPAALTSTVTTTPDSGNATGTATVTAIGGTPPYTYLWNTTPPQTLETAANLSVGNYSVDVTDANGCMINSSVDVVVGTKEIVNTYDAVKFSPNPAIDLLNITSSDKKIVELYNMTGQKVLELELEKGINSIRISKLPKGFYLAKVIGENGAVESSAKLVFSE